jgi:hypothetical protein
VDDEADSRSKSSVNGWSVGGRMEEEGWLAPGEQLGTKRGGVGFV